MMTALATAQFAQGQGVETDKRAKVLAVYAPRPQYPFEARVMHKGGSNGVSGVVDVTVEPETGVVTSAKMLKSTGNSILDNAALSACRQWRFQARTVSNVKIPISFDPTPVIKTCAADGQQSVKPH